ncbi:APC family permease [Adhaeretor mobilis]|uniref:Putative amino acid permease YhdG n=1 Tax=Adhaeretor mobilis TaxID=1930276 RepID=A0A517N2C8_9BACT|nr:amino acid permease [Adhaeretor mobilis]QDT01310.1 putative amino acid permease YhdG [Adhaeretor mobilis]
MTSPNSHATPQQLQRQVGVFGAMMMGLGSILGTGVFVSIGIAAGVTGASVVLAISVAAVVALLNGLSSAQLAANHPVSGGTYEYGYRWLHPRLGFTAGWMFLCAKSASAATAALGLASYGSRFLGKYDPQWLVPIACGVVALMTLLVLSGLRRSNWVNIAMVTFTLYVLSRFVLVGLNTEGIRNDYLGPFFAREDSAASFLQSCALMFVAFTGYGRIATLGEEVMNPRRTIPLAILLTLAVSAVLYISVGHTCVTILGAPALAEVVAHNGAPLEAVANSYYEAGAGKLVVLGALTAMAGVLLNLILGLSRVALAMGRRGDLPSGLAKINASGTTPTVAVVAVGVLIAGLTLLGDVKTTWSFSAFTVLVYYAITNLAATRLSEAERLYPRFIPWLGLAACLSLAFWVEPRIWVVGLALIAAGLVWQQLFGQVASR